MKLKGISKNFVEIVISEISGREIPVPEVILATKKDLVESTAALEAAASIENPSVLLKKKEGEMKRKGTAAVSEETMNADMILIEEETMTRDVMIMIEEGMMIVIEDEMTTGGKMMIEKEMTIGREMMIREIENRKMIERINMMIEEKMEIEEKKMIERIEIEETMIEEKDPEKDDLKNEALILAEMMRKIEKDK